MANLKQAKALFDEGEFSEAYKLLVKDEATLLQLYPACVLAGKAAMSLGHTDNAVKYLQHAAELDPSKMAAWVALSDLYSGGNQHEELIPVKHAQIEIAKTKGISDKLVLFSYQLGISYLKTGKLQQSMESLLAVLEHSNCESIAVAQFLCCNETGMPSKLKVLDDILAVAAKTESPLHSSEENKEFVEHVLKTHDIYNRWLVEFCEWNDQSIAGLETVPLHVVRQNIALLLANNKQAPLEHVHFKDVLERVSSLTSTIDHCIQTDNPSLGDIASAALSKPASILQFGQKSMSCFGILGYLHATIMLLHEQAIAAHGEQYTSNVLASACLSIAVTKGLGTVHDNDSARHACEPWSLAQYRAWVIVSHAAFVNGNPILSKLTSDAAIRCATENKTVVEAWKVNASESNVDSRNHSSRIFASKKHNNDTTSNRILVHQVDLAIGTASTLLWSTRIALFTFWRFLNGPNPNAVSNAILVYESKEVTLSEACLEPVIGPSHAARCSAKALSAVTMVSRGMLEKANKTGDTVIEAMTSFQDHSSELMLSALLGCMLTSSLNGNLDVSDKYWKQFCQALETCDKNHTWLRARGNCIQGCIQLRRLLTCTAPTLSDDEFKALYSLLASAGENPSAPSIVCKTSSVSGWGDQLSALAGHPSIPEFTPQNLLATNLFSDDLLNIGKLVWSRACSQEAKQTNNPLAEKAFQLFLSSAQIDSENGASYAALGEYYLGLDQLSDRKLVSYAHCELDLDTVDLKPRDMERALKCFKRATNANPLDVIALMWEIRLDILNLKVTNSFTEQNLITIASKFRNTLDAVEKTLYHSTKSRLNSKTCGAIAWMGLGQLQLYMYKFEPATNSFQKALTFVPDQEEYSYKAFASHVALHDSELNKFNTFKFRCWQRLGESYLRMGRNTASLRAFQTANEIATGSREKPVESLAQIDIPQLQQEVSFVWTRIGVMLLRLCRPDEAIEFLESAKQCSPGSLLVLQTYAEACLLQSSNDIMHGRLASAANACHSGRNAVKEALKCSDPTTHSLVLFGTCAPSLWKIESDLCAHLSTKLSAELAMQTVKATEDAETQHEMLFQSAVNASSQAVWLAPWEECHWHDIAALSHARTEQLKLSTCSKGNQTDILNAGLVASMAALALAPYSSTAWNTLGVVSRELVDMQQGGDVDSVLLQQHCFLEALKTDPKNSEAWQNFSYLLLNYGQLDAAKRALAEAQSIEPESHVLGVCHALIAERHWSNHTNNSVVDGSLLVPGQLEIPGLFSEDNVLAAFKCAVDAAGPVLDRASLFALSRSTELVLRSQGSYPKVVTRVVDVLCADLQRYTVRFPNDPTVLNMLGMCFELQGKNKEAMVQFGLCYKYGKIALNNGTKFVNENTQVISALGFVRCCLSIIPRPVNPMNYDEFLSEIMKFVVEQNVEQESAEEMFQIVNTVSEQHSVPWLECLLSRCRIALLRGDFNGSIRIVNDGARTILSDRLAQAHLRTQACSVCVEVVSQGSDISVVERFVQLAREVLVDNEYLVASVTTPDTVFPLVVPRSKRQKLVASVGLLHQLSVDASQVIEHLVTPSNTGRNETPTDTCNVAAEVNDLFHDIIASLQQTTDVMNHQLIQHDAESVSAEILAQSEILLAVQMAKQLRLSARLGYTNGKLSKDEVDQRIVESKRPLSAMVHKYPHNAASWLFAGEAVLASTQLVGSFGEDIVRFAYSAREAITCATNGMSVLKLTRGSLSVDEQSTLSQKLQLLLSQATLLYGSNSSFGLLSGLMKQASGLDGSGCSPSNTSCTAASVALYSHPESQAAQRQLALALLSSAAFNGHNDSRATVALNWLQHVWQSSLKQVEIACDEHSALQCVVDGVSLVVGLVVLDKNNDEADQVMARCKEFKSKCSAIAQLCLDRMLLMQQGRIAKVKGMGVNEVYKAYRMLLQSRPNDVEGWNELGIILEQYGNKLAAEKCFRKALKSNMWHAKSRSWTLPKKSKVTPDTCKMDALLRRRIENLK